MSDRKNRAVAYRWKVTEDADLPLQADIYHVHLYKGGTYRDLVSRRKYTVEEIDFEEATIRYTYTDEDGERVERIGELTDFAIVEAVEDSPGGLVDRGDGVR